MPTTYTSLLGLALPVTGELAGTWGDTVNDYITKYLDSSVAGTQTISGSQTAVTLTRANGGSLSPVGSGSTGSSQYQIINCTGNPAGTLTITVDVSTGTYALSNSTYSQTFAVINGTSTSQSVVVRATTTTGTSTGVTLVSGEKALIAWNGSDFIKVASSAVDGVSTFSAGTTGFTPSTATSGAVTLAGTLATTNGGTGLTSFTANRVFYSSSTSAIGSSANLTFDGTTLTANALTTTSTVTINGGTANGVAYLNGSKVLTTGSALTFDGTTFATTGRTSSANGAWVASGAVMGWGAAGTFTNYIVGDTASNYLLFQVNSAEGMRLTSTGLGIGTNSPAFRLDAVNNTAGLARFSFSDPNAGMTQTDLRIGAGSNTNDIFVGIQSGNSFIDDRSTNGALLFSRSGTEQMRLTSTGLGIGTSSPGAKLDVQGSAIFARVKSNSTTYNGFRAQNDNGNFYFGLDDASGTFYGAANARVLYADGAYPMVFYTNATERMRLDSSGNLGIGTTSPVTKLDVRGSTYIQSNSVAALSLNPGTDTVNSLFGITFSTPTYALARILAQRVGAADAAQLLFYTSPNGDVPNLRMTLDQSGNLGIGTSSPGYKVAAVVTGGADAFFADGNGQSYSGYRIRAGAGGQQWAFRGGTSTMALTDVTAGTDRMQIDTSGNLGLGVTPSAWGANYRALQIGLGGAINAGNGTFPSYVGLTANVRIDGTPVGKYLSNGEATVYQQNGGVHQWFTAPSGTAGNTISFTQAMSLDASGNLNLGVTSTQGGRLSVVSAASQPYSSFDAPTAGYAYSVLKYNGTAFGYIGQASAIVSGASNTDYALQATGNLLFATGGATERARITSGGEFLVGTTSASYAFSGRGVIEVNGSSQSLYGFRTGGTPRGYLLHEGTNLIVSNDTSTGYISFQTQGAERARITSVGNLSLGGTADRGTTVGTNAIQIFNGTAPAGTLTNGVSLYSQSGDLRFMDAAGNAYQVGFRNVPQSGAAKTGSYTLATGDVGEFIQISTGGSIVVPTSTFSAGDVVSLFNNTTGNITITCSALTTYVAGVDSARTSLTLATRGVATVLFISATVCVVSGNVS